MAKVVVSVTFEYECDETTVRDETDVMEQILKIRVKRELNAQSITIHDIQVEIPQN